MAKKHARLISGSAYEHARHSSFLVSLMGYGLARSSGMFACGF
jgi:hypothetical protein